MDHHPKLHTSQKKVSKISSNEKKSSTFFVGDQMTLKSTMELRPPLEVDDFRNADDLAKTFRAIDQDDARYEGGGAGR